MDIKDITRTLQLPYLGNNFDFLVEEAVNKKMGYADFIIDALALFFIGAG